MSRDVPGVLGGDVRVFGKRRVLQSITWRRGAMLALLVMGGCVFLPPAIAQGTSVQSPLPSVSDIVSMYRLNARVPKRLRVTFQEKRQPLGARSRAIQKKLQVAQQILATETLTEEQKLALEREIVNLKSRILQLPDEVSRWTLIDYWTDFANYQAQAKRLNDLAGPEYFGDQPKVDFPGLLIGGEELLTKYSGFQAVSFGSETDGKFRCWQAMPIEPYLGRIGLEATWPTMMHPPLVLPQEQWGAKINPCDEYILLAEKGDAAVAGFVTIDSRQLLLAYARSPQRSLRAFIDLEHGAIARRIEIFDYYLKDEFEPSFVGLCVDHPKLTAQHIVAAVDIDRLQCAGGEFFFPVSGHSVELSRAASKEDAVSPTQIDLAAYSSHEWTALAVDVDFEINEPGFALPFPAGTMFHDDVSGVHGWLAIREKAYLASRRPL